MSSWKGTTRRQILMAGAALPVLSLAGRTAWAADPLVLANWGGDSQKGMTDAFAVPYEKASGIKVVADPSGPSTGKVEAMVQSG